MEDEIKNYFKVWILATTCLCYCYYISSKLPKGIFRLISLLPVFYLFIILPLNLTSFHLGATTTFFLIWLGNFKLLLFSFDQGPLSPPLPKLFHFISLTYLPIKLKHQTNQKTHQNANSNQNSQILFIFFIKLLTVAILFSISSYKSLVHPYILLSIYCLLTYLELEIILAISAIPARALFGFELEPQFNEPYLATSLQDFWSRRWNLMVPSILQPTIYHPIRQFSMRFIGPKWASLPACIGTFAVSGLMHEIIYYYITRVKPTWEVTWFFVLHGICVAMEIAVKKMVSGRWQLCPKISCPLTLIFVAVTGFWLFFPQLLRNRIDDKVMGEYSFFVNFVKMKLMHSFF